MKQTIVLFFFLTAGALMSSNAQINLNFSAGVNSSNCEIKNFEGVSSKGRLGYFIGIAPNRYLNDKLNLVVDFQLSTKGCEMIYEDNSGSLEVRISYIDIIPEIEYKISDYLFLGVGVNSGFNINEAHKLENEGWANVKDFGIIELFDFGLTGKIKGNYKNFFGFVRYNFGLASISNIEITDITGQNSIDSNQYNRNLQIGVGYTLGLNK